MGACLTKSSTHKKKEPHQQAPPSGRRKNPRLSTVPIKREKPNHQNLNIQINQQQAPSPEKAQIQERTTIKGNLMRKQQKGFQHKFIKVQGQKFSEQELNSMGIGFVCKKGLKPESPNQDDFSIILDPNFKFFGVFDGHGYFGHQISNYTKNNLSKLLVNSQFNQETATQTIKQVFVQTNRNLNQLTHSVKAMFQSDNSGTTATIAYIKQNKIFIAHVGDSRAVLGTKRGLKFSATRLTTDHKPNLSEQKRRIQLSGGTVKKLPDDVPYRVFAPGEEGPGLSISRAIGDGIAQNLGVISQPDVSQISLDEGEYLLMCSDGVWEFISDNQAVSIVSKYGKKCQQAAEKLASVAWQKWIANQYDVVDDITAIVLYLPSFV